MSPTRSIGHPDELLMTVDPPFSVAAIPDNDVLQLTYTDPVTKQNVTCSDACNLAHDPTVAYQDFLFPSSRVITGFQITIESWYGAGAGLHLLQLLSSGAFATAVGDDNVASCYAPEASNVVASGQWTPVNAYTDIAGTTQNVLTTTVPVGTSSSAAPSLTWHPYVSASGQYEVYVMVPGCQNLQDCGSRTTVKVTVLPGGGLPPSVSTVSQRVDVDTRRLVYSGPIFPSLPDYTSTVTLTLADSPEGNGAAGRYTMVADGIQFLLTSIDTGNSTVGTGVGGAVASSPGFGFFEWSPAANNVNATALLPNATRTPLDGLAPSLYNAIGASSVASTSFSIRAVVPPTANSILFAGQFALPAIGATNFAAFSDGRIIPVGGNGLNGIVNTMVQTSDKQTVFVAGAFTDTADSSSSRYRGVVQYDVATSSWAALGGGVDGAVVDLSLQDSNLHIAGNFTRAFANAGDNVGVAVAGSATFDLKAGTWVQSGGFLIGAMTLTETDGPGSDNTQYIAGSVAASRRFGGSGWAIVKNGPDGQPAVEVTPSRLSAIGASPATVAHAKRYRASSSNWFSRVASHILAKRQNPAGSMLPGSPAAPAPAVLAGTFWTNTSTMNEVVILGGNFSLPAGSSMGAGVALYDVGTKFLKPLNGNQIDGVVRSLYVLGNDLFVGGQFSVPGVDGLGFAVYDLAGDKWINLPNQALQGEIGSAVLWLVRSIDCFDLFRRPGCRGAVSDVLARHAKHGDCRRCIRYRRFHHVRSNLCMGH